jgi:hypothetical protein
VETHRAFFLAFLVIFCLPLALNLCGCADEVVQQHSNAHLYMYAFFVFGPSINSLSATRLSIKVNGNR